MGPFDDSSLRNSALGFNAFQTQTRVSNTFPQAHTHTQTHNENFRVLTPTLEM